METPTETRQAPAAAASSRVEPRQRWRLTFARAASDPPSGREYIGLWETALGASRLPLATTDAGKPRFALGAPLPARTEGRAELADLWLTERIASWRVREALERVLPAGHELVSLEDVWLGGPALSGRVAAADYLVMVPAAGDREGIVAGAAALMAAGRLTRERPRGGGTRTYDLRPLLVSIDVGDTDDPGDPIAVRIRARIHPELGSGRPEEIVAALADQLGRPLEPIETVRERLVLIDDLAD